MIKKSSNKLLISNASKSKKSSSKDREKRKIQGIGEPGCSNSNSEKIHLSNNLECDQKYSGFDSDTIQCIAEQFIGEKVDDNISANLAEDVSYKIREILQAACINMRQAKRRHLKVDDLNATFKKFNLERIYGPALPNWVTFGDPDNLSCIPETTIDLLDLANSDLTSIEPGDLGIDSTWLSDSSLFNQIPVQNGLNNYAQKIMKAAASTKKNLRNLALRDVAKNTNIGPVIKQFCNFCFLILQKNITYSCLATPALEFLEAVMFNPSTSFSVEEKQMTLLIYLLLENIMNATNEMLDEITPICRTLGRLCIQFPRGAQIVTEKVSKYLSTQSPAQRLTAPVIRALSYIGNEALNTLLWPNISEVLKYIEGERTEGFLQINAAVLNAAALMYKQDWTVDISRVEEVLCFEFGDGLVPIWRGEKSKEERKEDSAEMSLQTNWLNIKKALVKSQRVHSQQQYSHRFSQHKQFFRKSKPIQQKIIRIVNYKALPVRRRIFPILEDARAPKIVQDCVSVICGKRTLFTLKRSFKLDNVSIEKNVRDMMYMI